MSTYQLAYEDGPVTLYRGDCREVMASLPDNSVDAIVTDPPYELGFMGKGWDSSGIAFDPIVWSEALRVLKPGGHALVFGGTRTWHRVAVAVEDAGFEIRDSFAWLHGQGFPKSMDVSAAIDKSLGHDRQDAYIERAGVENNAVLGKGLGRNLVERRPSSEDAEKWQGWGTALKPAFEPVVMARKTLAGTVAATVLEYGTGALNVDASRIATSDKLGGGAEKVTTKKAHEGWNRPWMDDEGSQERHAETVRKNVAKAEKLGRYPSNVLLDETQAAELDEQSGVLSSGTMRAGTRRQSPGSPVYGRQQDLATSGDTYGDSGGASRFFYVAKAGRGERPVVDGHQHATVKPLALMRYLVRMVTPPGGTVLEPFAGSGTTIEAAVIEGFNVIAAELDEDGTHIPLIMKRLGKSHQQTLFGDVA